MIKFWLFKDCTSSDDDSSRSSEVFGTANIPTRVENEHNESEDQSINDEYDTFGQLIAERMRQSGIPIEMLENGSVSSKIIEILRMLRDADGIDVMNIDDVNDVVGKLELFRWSLRFFY